VAWLGGSRNFKQIGQHGLRDLIVARRGFAFEAEPVAEAVLVRRILDAFPPGTPVYGYPFVDDPVYAEAGYAGHSEAAGVSEISSSGKELLPSTDSVNLTVHGSYPPVCQRPPWDDRPRLAKAGKTYVTFVISDGDNLGWDQGRLRVAHWDDPRRGSMPIGISISPLLATHAPRIYAHYLATMTPNEVFVAGPSGAGYAYPGLHSDLGGYLTRTRKAMDFAGLRAVWILDMGYAASPTPETIRRYVDALRPSVIFADYGGWVLPNPPSVSFSGDVPVLHAAWGENVANTANRIRGESLLQRSSRGHRLRVRRTHHLVDGLPPSPRGDGVVGIRL
jgi:putative glycoside hydrolase with GxGYxYP motif/GxGYxY motif-containing protein